MYSLAHMHSKGQGTVKDAYRAYYWAVRSELGGIRDVEPLKNALIPQMISRDITRAADEAVKAHGSSTALVPDRR